ncbi:hypothetical protein, partial [Pseudomonas aeruginosa]|uniref:hypothetical protein n=1 Tax=Pseudomonas aeruginosa TaxID=287 RepID=UPI0027958024
VQVREEGRKVEEGGDEAEDVDELGAGVCPGEGVGRAEECRGAGAGTVRAADDVREGALAGAVLAGQGEQLADERMQG